MSLLRFDRFMEHALFHPSEGYYARHIKTVGKEGDFSTSATLSKLLAKSVAKWISTQAQQHQFNRPTLIEVGAGTGQLFFDVYKALPFLFRRKCKFYIVEKSPILQTQQQDRLGKKVTWRDNLSEILQESKGEALVFSNELVDAFPVRVFRVFKQGFEELHLDTKSRSEVFLPIEGNTPDSSFFKNKLAEGLRFEVHESYQNWLKEWLPDFKKGTVLTIDYGDSLDDLLQKNPLGSLRAYFKHHVMKGASIYQNVGHQDITSDVNFSDLEYWGEHFGLSSSLISQKDFLISSATAIDSYLRDEDGAGTAFKVLTQRKA
jgi:SAM-dependent MidA family methyltransferase